MRGEIVCVARPGVAAGLRLAGLEAVEAETPDPTAAALDDLSPDDVAVVLVESALWDALPAEARERIEARPAQLVMPFPSPTRLSPEERADAYLVEMLRRAVGYRVRLR